MARPNFGESCTKIIASVGPACRSVPMLRQLIEHGVDIFRINSAHGTRQEHAEALSNIREAADQCQYPVGILLDLSGPKLRLGKLAQDPLHCRAGMQLDFVRGTETNQPNELVSGYDRLIDELEPGNTVMLADGTVTLQVESKSNDRVTCVVTAAGDVRSRQGIHLPGVSLSVSTMRKEDVDNAIWGAEAGIDFISLSFVRSAADVLSLKSLLASYESNALVIAKIEKREALVNLEAIVDAADGVMVARGDLGVEIDVAETPVAQKRIINICTEKMKPVIVATQMLESMHHNKRPTRAEASDVANAILDGTDACMLSGETAVGDFPTEAVDVMSRIMSHTEQELIRPNATQHYAFHRVHPITSAVAQSATNIAESINANLIVIATRSGGTAWVKSKHRSLIPTLGVSDDPVTLRRMNLFWGVKPLQVAQLDDTLELFDEVTNWGCYAGILEPGDHVVVVTGNGVLDKAHNLLVVLTVTAEKCPV